MRGSCPTALLGVALALLAGCGAAAGPGGEAAGPQRVPPRPTSAPTGDGLTGIAFRNGAECLADTARPLRGRSVYVSSRGSDRNAGTSRAAALRSLALAVCNLRPGQTLHVLPGTYRESVILALFGRAGKPITIRGVVERGKRPVLDGQGRRSYGLGIGESRNLVIENLEFRNFADAGLYFLLGSDVVVRGNVFAGNGRASTDPDAQGEGFGLNVDGTKRVLIERNEAVGNGPNEERRKRFLLGTGINTFELVDGVIRANRMHGNIGGGLLIEDGRNVLAERNVITGNWLDANGDYWDGAIWVDGSRNVTLRRNRIARNHGPGIQVSDEDRRYPKASYGTVLDRNTVTGNLFGLYVWNFGRCPVTNPRILRLTGNTIVQNTRRDLWCVARQ